MAKYFLAPVLAHFRENINQQFPRRDISSDGWIGDPSHAARKSEHNPCWTCVGYLHGVVRAIDIDIDDNDAGRDLRKEIIAVAVGHRSVWYVISNGIIWSRSYDWKPRKYNGPNPHTKHVHISCWITPAAAKDTTLVLRRPAKPEAPLKLDAQDRDFIEKTVQKFSAFNAENLRQRIDDIANAAARAVDVALDDDLSIVNAKIDALKTELGLKK